jgi:hypothetical protein
MHRGMMTVQPYLGTLNRGRAGTAQVRGCPPMAWVQRGQGTQEGACTHKSGGRGTQAHPSSPLFACHLDTKTQAMARGVEGTGLHMGRGARGLPFSHYPTVFACHPCVQTGAQEGVAHFCSHHPCSHDHFWANSHAHQGCTPFLFTCAAHCRWGRGGQGEVVVVVARGEGSTVPPPLCTLMSW